MPADGWQGPVLRWGDALYGIALLLSDDRERAMQQTVATFARVLAAPPADVELALFRDLLAQRWPRRRFGQPHELPLRVRRLAPADRALLALWLLHGYDGARLAALSRLTPETLLMRLERALRQALADALPRFPSLPADDTWRDWIAAELGLRTAPDHPPAGWAALLNAARSMLRGAIGRAGLPPLAREEIEDAILRRREELQTPWWRRPAGTLGLVLLGVALGALLVIAPWRRSAPPASLAPVAPQELARRALDGWESAPLSGTLHRRVWARDPWASDARAALITDVWIEADEARHRVEMRRGSTLVEWQLGNGRDTLLYAALPGNATCRWPDLPLLGARAARRLVATPEQQRTALRMRLQLGAYGLGYTALRDALTATDLRSLGTRVANGLTLTILAYSTPRDDGPRELLLWIDAQSGELHRVQELVATGAQSTVQDLWRLEQRERLPTGVVQRPPEWRRSSGQRQPLFDPGCPVLEPEAIASLRALVGSNAPWSIPWLPVSPPPGIDEAILIAPRENATLRAILRGPQRWVTLGVSGRLQPNQGRRYGDWIVELRQERGRWLGVLCWQPAARSFCPTNLLLTAGGWSEAELLALIESLAPVDLRTWQALDELFVDPQPLDPDLRALLQTSAATLERESGLRYLRARREQALLRAPSPARDPYAPAPELLYPATLIDEYWIDQAGDENARPLERVQRFARRTRLPDGALLSAEQWDGAQYLSYDAREGLARVRHDVASVRLDMPLPPAGLGPERAMLTLALSLSSPARLEQTADAWRITYPLSSAGLAALHGWLSLFGLELTPQQAADLTSDQYLARITIDRATHRPQRADLLTLGGAGQEQLRGALTIEERRTLSAASAASVFAPPALPADAFVVEEIANGFPRLLAPTAALEPPAGFLVWSEQQGITVVRNQEPNRSYLGRSEMFVQALYSGFQALDDTGLIKITTYHLPALDPRVEVTVRQGNATLLRHILRRVAVLEAPSERVSRPLAVTLGGAPATAWLIETLPRPVLIVERDNLLLHISGPDAETLATIVADQLARMTWRAAR
ncbi:hypothetical protein [Kallotenue papyrolyticum]|uniref:hypothetical protein n=1 Tax=Kallotenue papyrolyticum TaxID=1325125 RepID=UPI0004785865|nr:hypothetical protein [Kallotenue papyrolyticum]